jgi:hypothetical protein
MVEVGAEPIQPVESGAVIHGAVPYNFEKQISG